MNISVKEELINENDEKRHWIIYMYTFPNGKRYIGKTRQGSLTTRKHGNTMIGYKNSKYIYSAIQKYGVENIKDTILFEGEITDDYADRLEQIYILLFKTNACIFNNPKYGYNLTDGGGGMRNWHPDDIERRTAQLKEALRNKGYTIKVTDKITNEVKYFEYQKDAAAYYKVSRRTIGNYINNVTVVGKYPNLKFENVPRTETNRVDFTKPDHIEEKYRW